MGWGLGEVMGALHPPPCLRASWALSESKPMPVRLSRSDILVAVMS